MPTVLAQSTIVVPTFEGVTTAVVAFVFVCVIFPTLVKNKTQFYAAFMMVLVVILLHSLSIMIRTAGFQVFAGAVTGLLQIGAVVLLFLGCGGITIKQLGGELSRAYEVIRRGEEEKQIIVPLTGEMPKPRGSASPPSSPSPSYSHDLAKAIREEEEALDRDEPAQPPPPPQPSPSSPPTRRDDSSLPLE